MNKTELQEILEKHQKWLNDEPDGIRANLYRADLSSINLRYVNLSGAILNYANLSNVDLTGADLRCANLHYADLSGADLNGADLNGADLGSADLKLTNLSGAKGLLSAIHFIDTHFERTNEGYIAYKTFNEVYPSPKKWNIRAGSILTENVNFDRCCDCGCGINVAPLEWVKVNYPNQTIWKVLIRYEWLSGVCVPYHTGGKIRCERVELIEIVE